MVSFLLSRCPSRFSLIRVFLVSVCILSATSWAVFAQSNQIPSEYLSALDRVKRNPSDPEASFRLAQIAAQTGDFQTAISAFERILLLNPTLANIKLELGVLYLRQGAPKLAENYISEALKSPDAPPAVRERAEELLAIAEQSNSRWRLTGRAAAGLIVDSNANAGPDNGTEVRGFVVLPDFTDQSDVSAFVGLSGKLKYDLGLQAGHLLALDVDLFARGYRDQTQLNLSRGGIAFGTDLNLTRALSFPAELALRYSTSSLRRDDERYVSEDGWVAKFRAVPNAQNSFEFSAFTFDQDYHATTLDPSNDNRDGRRSGFSLRYSRLLTEKTGLNVVFAYSDKSAEEGFEAYRDSGFFVEVLREISPLLGKSEDPWKISAAVGYGQRKYDEPDPAIDDNASQKDERVVLRTSMFVPLTDSVELQLELGHFDQNSNYSLDTFDNTYLAFSVTKSF